MGAMASQITSLTIVYSTVYPGADQRKHQSSASLAFVRGIHGSLLSPRTKASDAEFWCLLWSAPWINGWIDNRQAGYLRRHRTHYDIIVMAFKRALNIDEILLFTHWDRDKMATISRTTFSNTCSLTRLMNSIKISLKFVRKGPINNIPALVQTMAWHRPGDKPLSEPMVFRLPTHICVIRLNEL